jgi:hypothetical protein
MIRESTSGILPTGEMDGPEIALNAPDDQVVAPMENLSGGVRFDRVSHRRA